MDYKILVKEIINLPWESLSTEKMEELMILSMYNAIEFAQGVRILLKTYPDNNDLIIMAQGELETKNLSYSDYNKKGDHSDFLKHFVEKCNLNNKYPRAVAIGEEYIEEISKLDNNVRALSIISREDELHKIFEKIIRNPNFNTDALKAYKFYLEKHIKFDSEEGGHADLVSGVALDESIYEFYRIRLNAYKKLFNL